jgi:hypothetical protein
VWPALLRGQWQRRMRPGSQQGPGAAGCTGTLRCCVRWPHITELLPCWLVPAQIKDSAAGGGLVISNVTMDAVVTMTSCAEIGRNSGSGIALHDIVSTNIHIDRYALITGELPAGRGVQALRLCFLALE